MKYYDWFVVIGVLGFFGAGLATTFISYTLYDISETPAQVQAVIQLAEVNPWFGKLLIIQKVNILISVIVPVILSTIYFYLRRKLQEESMLETIAFMILLLGVVDFLNDAAALLGLLISAGVLK